MSSPAFQFYPADWLSSETVASATLVQEGIYIRLLCYAWREGSIPADATRCAAIVGKGVKEDDLRVVQGWFNQSSTDAARLVHTRLEAEREKQRAWSEKSAIGGKKSAEKRQKTRVMKGGSTTVARVVQPNGNSSSSFSSSDNTPLPPDAPASPPLGNGRDVLPTTEEAKAISILFHRRPDTAWDEKEIAKFKKLVKRGVITTEAIVVISAYYAHERSKGGDGQHRRALPTFLNNFDGELDRARAFKQNPNAHEKRPASIASGSSRNVGHNVGLDYSQRPDRKTPNGTTGGEGESPQLV